MVPSATASSGRDRKEILWQSLLIQYESRTANVGSVGGSAIAFTATRVSPFGMQLKSSSGLSRSWVTEICSTHCPLSS